MTAKEKFIEEMETYILPHHELSDEAMDYFNTLKTSKGNSKVITENGLKVLQFMQENWEKHGNMLRAAEIGEGLFMSGRSVSGSMRKLVSDGYVKKEGKDPVVYSITEKGKAFTLTE